MSPNETTARARRRRETRASVRVAERVARGLISVGGIGTIAAVTLMFVFLVSVAWPLFRPSRAHLAGVLRPSDVAAAEEMLAIGVDEYRLLAWTLRRDASLELWRLDAPVRLHQLSLAGAAGAPTAWSLAAGDGQVAAAYADGTVRIGEIGFLSRTEDAEDVPEALRALAPGEAMPWERAMVQRTPEGQLRFQDLSVSLGDPVDLAVDSPPVLLDHAATQSGSVLCLLTDDGQAWVGTARTRTNLLTGAVTTSFAKAQIPFGDLVARGRPSHLALGGAGDTVYFAWEDGHVARFDLRDPTRAALAEELDLVPEPGGRLTALRFLIGRGTLVAGDSHGRVRCWFRIKPDGCATIDGSTLVLAHELAPFATPVTALAASQRSRLLAAGAGDGSVHLYYVPNEALRVALGPAVAGDPVSALALAPKEDGLLVVGPSGFARYDLDLGHPEASVSALARPVWYEGYPRPEHTWQSSSGTDDFEPKLGLWPLVFGTLKATLYSMLFGVPIALLAAVYTSEFLNPRLRTPVKSAIEMMASLPSVVLGFLAAIVFAPVVQDHLSVVLGAFLTMPFAVLLAAHLWQLLPQDLTLRFSGWPRLAAAFVALAAGALAAFAVGPWITRTLFAGDAELWLDGQRGEAGGAWFVLLLPLAVLAALFVVGRSLGPWVRGASATWSRARCAWAALGVFLAGTLAALALAGAGGGLLQAQGADPRGSVLDTYVQRNALVVGFVMGFAIIPIIFTLAEDALSSVPAHLRHASLGAGATNWQTAMRIVVPTAMSGIFSALMVGLGRAVGETMIVLMAAGNTPVLSWNVFDGFRTLSANIAVELPEAVRDSTHYRTLFLAGLVLFAMTFVVNTLAELVRQRFRKRAYQL